MAGPLRTIVGVAALPFLFLTLTPADLYAGRQAPLAAVKGLTCTFSLMAAGTWTDGAPQSQITPRARPSVLRFESINVDGGSADAFGVFVGVNMASPIVVQRIGADLQVTQMLRSGPLYATTVFDQESHPGKFKAVHVRHESSAIAIPGFTSTPEQYYGECEPIP